MEGCSHFSGQYVLADKVLSQQNFQMIIKMYKENLIPFTPLNKEAIRIVFTYREKLDEYINIEINKNN